MKPLSVSAKMYIKGMIDWKEYRGRVKFNKMKKEEFIRQRGEAAYKKMLQQSRDWGAQHPKEIKAYRQTYYVEHREDALAKRKEWGKDNPDKVLSHNHESNRKGGKFYEKKLIYNRTGLQGERRDIRNKHNILYHAIKQATPNSVLHHEWVPGTAKYRGVALVEKEAHENGIIKVIKILEGQITLFTEKEIRADFEYKWVKEEEENEKLERARMKSVNELIDAFYEKRKKESEE